ncbi:MAG: glycosyltransferase family 2 protein [Oscillospiraceae bacterium]|nr:glycosyltransferase family 2 protein [Oscillospiraceae bacterium]
MPSIQRLGSGGTQVEDKKLISVIVPCYNEQEVLPMFYKEIMKISREMQTRYPETEFEYLFIDDGSKDRTLKTLRTLAQHDKRVRYISFSRNFGKEAGIYAGLSNAKGDYCVVMDADLQHPPAFLPKMYEAVRSGQYDCATTRRVSRAGESKVRSWFAKLFYKIMNKISQTEIVDGAQDFRFMSRQMVDAVLSMSEYNRFSKGIFSWVGFRVKYLEYENVERAAGTSAWSFWGLFRYSLEGIIGFSTAPLTATAIIGFISCLLGLILLIFTVIKRLVVGGDPLGYPTTTCCVVFFGGLQVFCTGILGLYLGKTYLEVKHRPIYLVRETEETAAQYEELPEEAETAAHIEKLETAKRLKEETDAEFDAIVDAAFAEEDEEEKIDRVIAAEAEYDGDGYDTDGNDTVTEEETFFEDGIPVAEEDLTNEDIKEESKHEKQSQLRTPFFHAPELRTPVDAQRDADRRDAQISDIAEPDAEPDDHGREAARDDRDGTPDDGIAARIGQWDAQLDERLASLDERLASLDDQPDDEDDAEPARALTEAAEEVAEEIAEEAAEEIAEDAAETAAVPEPETAAEAEEEAEPAPAPAPKKKEKFEIKIDYDSIDFDEDYEDDPRDDAEYDEAYDDAEYDGAYDRAGYEDDLDPYYDEDAPRSFKDKIIDFWYMLVNSVDSFRYSVAEKLNRLGKGGFDEDAIERQIDMDAGFDDDFDRGYDDAEDDGYDEDGYAEDDGYDDDLDPTYDENAEDFDEDDDDYRG